LAYSQIWDCKGSEGIFKNQKKYEIRKKPPDQISVKTILGAYFDYGNPTLYFKFAANKHIG
jgi:hypothetical protein